MNQTGITIIFDRIRIKEQEYVFTIKAKNSCWIMEKENGILLKIGITESGRIQNLISSIGTTDNRVRSGKNQKIHGGYDNKRV